MATPLCGKVLLATALVSGLVLLFFPVYPLATFSFEAGLVVGLLLHSSHTSYAISSGHLTERFKS
jgi:hypothetical protein